MGLINKSEIEPACFKKFVKLVTFPDISTTIEEKNTAGFSHCRKIIPEIGEAFPPDRVAVGTMDYEYRIFTGLIFIKGELPTPQELIDGKFVLPVFVMIVLKYYHRMSSIGKSLCYGECSPSELSELLKFFECKVYPHIHRSNDWIQICKS